MWRQQQQQQPHDHVDMETMQIAQALVQLVGGLTNPNDSSGRHRPPPEGPLFGGASQAMGPSGGPFRNGPGMPQNGRDFPNAGHGGPGAGSNLYAGSNYGATAGRPMAAGNMSNTGTWSSDGYPAGNMSNTGTGTWSGDGYPLRANESRPMGGSSGGPRNNFSAAGGGGRAGQKSGSFGKGKSSEQLTAEERKEALTKLWSGYRGSDFDVVPQKYLKCRDCNVRYRYQ